MKRWLPLAGWLLSLGSMSILLMSARWKLTFDPWYVKEWGRLGWDPTMLPRIAILQLACVVLYLTPRTGGTGCRVAHGISWRRDLAVHAARGTVSGPRSADDGAAGVGWTVSAGGAAAGAASFAQEDSASPLTAYSNPRERCMRSYDFSFSRQNSSTSSVSSSMCWLKFTVNGFV